MNESDAQEILLAVLSGKKTLVEAGTTPRRVVLSMKNYRILQQFHATLGELPNPELDYITRYTVFGLSVFIDDGVEISVQ